jgi:hypothetical protein
MASSPVNGCVAVGVAGDPLRDVHRQALAVIDFSAAVNLGEKLQVIVPLGEGLGAVLRLVQGEVAVDDVGHAERAGGGVVPGALENLHELPGSELFVLGAFGCLEEADLPPLDVGEVGLFVGGLPGTGETHEGPPLASTAKEGRRGAGW